MAQVYRFTDENGVVRLVAEIDPAPGGGSPAYTTTTVTIPHATLIGADIVGAGIEAIAAPGAGKLLLSPATTHGLCVIDADTAAGAYTINSSARWNFYLENTADSVYWNGAHDVLSFGAANIQPLMPGAGVRQNGLAINGVINDDAPADVLDSRLLFAIDNQGSGQLTGGNVANSVTLTISYAVLAP